MKPNPFSQGRRGNSFLNYNFTSDGQSSITLGNGNAGSKSFVSPASGIPTEGGSSEVYKPGLKQSFAGPEKSHMGLFQDMNIIAKLFPGAPGAIPEKAGIAKIAITVAGVAFMLRSNSQ